MSFVLLSGLTTGAAARGRTANAGEPSIEIHMGVLDQLSPVSGPEGRVIRLHMPVYRRARVRPVPLPLAPPLALEAKGAAEARPAEKAAATAAPEAAAPAPAETTAKTTAEASPAAPAQAPAQAPAKTPAAPSAAVAASPAPPPAAAKAQAPAAAPSRPATSEVAPKAAPAPAAPATPKGAETVPAETAPAAPASGGGNIVIGGALGGGELPAPPPPPPQSQTQTAPAGTPAPSVKLSIPFAANKATISPQAQSELSKLAAVLAGSNERVELKAYAAKGAADGARMLSLTRALAVRAYLMNKGVADTRIDVRALGVAPSGPPDRVDVRALAE